jgi:hypothetical protein
MIRFSEFILEEVTEDEIDALIESIVWEDIIDMYDESELVMEAISATERIKMSQKLKSRKFLMAMARRVKLRRAAPTDILTKRSKVSARKLVMNKLLKGRNKTELSASERNNIEARASKMLTMMKNLPTKLLPKVRELDRQRVASRGKK